MGRAAEWEHNIRAMLGAGSCGMLSPFYLSDLR